MSGTATSFYQTGGTLPGGAPSYVERRADKDLYEGLSRGEFCYVLHARQMGKSSLMVHTTTRLRQEGIAVAAFELTALGQNLTVEQWYDGLLGHVGRQLGLEDELDDFWLEHERLGPLQRWMGAIREVVLRRCPGRLVIFIDEIDAVRSLPFSTDEFFAAIRECYNRRAQDPEFQRLTFCLLGVASPSDLIRDPRMTPFNVGQRIELTDFTAAEAAPLAAGIADCAGTREAGGRIADCEAILGRILYWTGGHPYLTQRLCRAAVEAIAQHPNPQSAIRNPQSVDRLCEALFLAPAARERDDNLLFVRERLLRSEVDRASLLGLYSRVRSPREQVADEETNPLVSLLRLSGVVREVDGCLQVRNRIYARVFDREWIVANMPDAELRRLRALAREEARKRRLAEAAQRLAEEREVALRRNLYAADVNLAQQAWEVANLGRARELLDAHRPRGGQEDLRGFEWRYLWRLCQDEALFTLRGHTSWVFSVAFSPDGTTLASGGSDNVIKLWDLATRQEIATLQGHTSRVIGIAFSPDGRTLASGGADGTARLWDATTRHELATLERDPLHYVASVAFSPDGAILATVGGNRRVKLWDVATRRELATLEGSRSSLRFVAISPDGKILAAGPDDGTTRLWDLTTRELKATLRYGGPIAFHVKILAIGTRLWDAVSGRELVALHGHTGWLISVAFSPDGKTLASGGSDHTLRLWDVAASQEVATLKGHQDGIWSVAFSPDGKTVATGSHDDTVKLWDAVPKRETSAIVRQSAGVRSLAFSPDGSTLAIASRASSDADTPGGVTLWDIATEQKLAALEGDPDGAVLAFSPDGKALATGHEDGGVRWYDLTTKSEVVRWGAHQGAVRAMAFSPDQKILATGADTTVKVWDVAGRPMDARELAALPGHSNGVVDVAFSPDGKTLAAANGAFLSSTPGDVTLWDAATGQKRAMLRGHRAAVLCAAFSPDGQLLASGSADNTVQLWDLTRREPVATLTLRGHKNWVKAVAFSPDGKTLATGSTDVRLWSVPTGREVLKLTHPQGYASSLRFSPDGTLLAAASADGTLRLWRAATFAEADARDGAAPPRSSR